MARPTSHLLITQHTAHYDRPVSRPWLGTALRGQQTAVCRLRQDLVLNEAAGVRDPLHLAAVFGGLRPVTAQRYDAVHGRLDSTIPGTTTAEPTLR